MADEKPQAELTRVEYLLREAMASAVRLAITRHNLELDPDAATEEEIAYDAAGACFGEECCNDKPIAEVAELLRLTKHCPQPRSQPDYPAILERERTLVAEGITAVKKAIQCREWLTEGRGSYEWDDDRWHGEFAAAITEILQALEPLKKVAADFSNCPKTAEEVQRARTAPAEPRSEEEDRRAFEKWGRHYFSAGISHEMWPKAVEDAYFAGLARSRAGAPQQEDRSESKL